MGYSRATFVKFTTGEDAVTLCSGLREAFDYFGGVPEHVLFDNTKAVVIERDAYGPGLHRWNDELKALAEVCGFTPRLCRPYRAKTKGKVERFNSYLKGSFVVPLAATHRGWRLALDVDAANAACSTLARRDRQRARARHNQGCPFDAIWPRSESVMLPAPAFEGAASAADPQWPCRWRACSIRWRSTTSCSRCSHDALQHRSDHRPVRAAEARSPGRRVAGARAGRRAHRSELRRLPRARARQRDRRPRRAHAPSR